MVKVNDISKSYGNLKVLNGISFEVKEGEILALCGPSGAGKSTLLQILGTLDKPDSGAITLKGIELEKLRDREISAFRNRHIGFVFQFHHLLAEFSALENICIPAMIAGKSLEESTPAASALLAILGIAERAHHKPGELSGGEQQRVAVARALINRPDLVLADEPSGNLDTAHARTLHNLFFDLRKKLNQTFIIATHNEELAAMSDRRLIIKDGNLTAVS